MDIYKKKVKYTQRKVRQRARFLCENCRKSTQGQYAHIIPDAWEGKYATENMLFLCEDCHHKFDYSVFERDSKKALKYLEMIKNLKKENNVIEHTFYFLTDKVVVKIGGGITLEDCSSIFESADGKPLLTIGLDQGKLILTGKFFDQTGNVILEIKENKFHAHGSVLWDLSLKTNGELNLVSKDKKIYLNIRQNKDESLNLHGKLFIEGDLFEITGSGIYQPSRNIKLNNNVKRGSRGIILAKNTLAI